MSRNYTQLDVTLQRIVSLEFCWTSLALFFASRDE